MRTITPKQREAAQARRTKFRELVKQVAAMTSEQRDELAERMGAVVNCEGRTLSIFNTCLLLQQHATPTIVGGFRQWRKQGRTVRKGQRGLTIWIPGRAKARTETPDAADADDANIRFFMGTVFDISQTTENAPAYTPPTLRIASDATL